MLTLDTQTHFCHHKQ